MSRVRLVACQLQRLAWLCALCAGGCSTLRLPAIDPTGRHIFQTDGRYTTLVPPGPLACVPTPAFTEPPVPPPCGPLPPPPQLAAPSGLDCSNPLIAAPPAAPPSSNMCPLLCQPGRHGRLTLTPAFMMAPVGSEVVFVASLFDERGALVSRQPIEWMLAPDSVGQITATGEESDCFRLVRSRTAEKRSGSYAVTKTMSSPHVLTRGTPQPNDDVHVQRGQSWIGLTSPTEGTSHVTVLAPEADNWEQRRQTATIYWVDVRWTLPTPAIVQAGQPQTLSTTLRRASGKPLADWIVRYELTGTGTTFAPNNQAAIDIRTDANGVASVNLQPAQKSTSVPVVIKIIRPSKTDDEVPPMVVGQGWTSVTWSAADPKVRLTGPETAGLGSTITYRADISNAGDIVAHRVVASTSIPPNMTYVSSNPPAKVMGNVLTWELNDLPPQSVRPIQITCRPERNGAVRFCVRAESADQLQGKPQTAEACLETRVFSSGLAVKLTGPKSGQTGQRVVFQIQVSNVGPDPLNNVTISDRLSPGLEHPTEPGSLIRRSLDQPLAPGATESLEVELIVKQAGRLCHTVDVVAEGGHSATANACLDAVAVPLAAGANVPNGLSVTISGPERSRVGDTAKYVMKIANTSNLPLTRMWIVTTFDPSLLPTGASPADWDKAAMQRGEIAWYIERLEPGKQLDRIVGFECARPAPAAWCRVFVQTAENLRTTQEQRTQILPGEKPEPRQGSGAELSPPVEPGPEAITGELKVTVVDTRDPVALNGSTTYIISIENARNVSDKKVKLTLFVPPGMEFIALNGPVTARGKSEDGRTIEVTEIAEVRAGETLPPFRVEVRGKQIGKHTFKVRVNSFRSAQPVDAEQDTTVNASG